MDTIVLKNKVTGELTEHGPEDAAILVAHGGWQKFVGKVKRVEGRLVADIEKIEKKVKDELGD